MRMCGKCKISCIRFCKDDFDNLRIRFVDTTLHDNVTF